MAHVIVRAHKWMPNYLRTLPLHHSQRELESTPDYTDFSYDIRPTSDFLGELLRHSNGIEVLEPLDLREKMRQMIVTTQFTTLAPASETGNNIFIPALQIRLKIVTFASASK